MFDTMTIAEYGATFYWKLAYPDKREKAMAVITMMFPPT